MRKLKILAILLVALFLTACTKSIPQQLEDLGYTEEEVTTITSYSEDLQNRFLESYNEDLFRITENPEFKEENLDLYLKYDGQFDDELMFRLVNNDIVNDSNLEKLKDLYSNEYYLEKNEDKYLYYIDKFDSVRDAIEVVNTYRYLDLYTFVDYTDTSKDYLLLVNKYFELPSDYAPTDLVAIDSMYGKGETRSFVYDSYKQLYEDALTAGYTIKIVSAYRSYDYQVGLYNKYLGMDTQENVDTYSARPGHSEHQSGLCLDVSVPGISIDDFYKTDACTWLNENCYKYGFIIRYPEDKVDITGYQWESWQIRYVGNEAAKYIHDTGITYDEYYAVFVDR